MPTTTGKATEFLTFSRASLATVTDADGKIKWAPHNLLSASEQFDASAWSRSGVSGVTANSTAAPNGTTTADTIVEDTSASANHFVAQTPAIAAGQQITYGVWVKRGSGTRNIAITLIASGGSDYISQVYDLGAGTLGSSTAVGTGVITDKTITAGASGWYYITLTGIASTSAALTGGACRLAMANGTTFGSQTYTGDGTSSVILWGASLTRSDLGGMQANTSAYPLYNPTTRPNWLGYTEDLTNAYWALIGIGAASAPTRSSISGVTPAGLTANITRLSFPSTSNNQFDLSLFVGNTSIAQTTVTSVTGSIWVRRISGGTKIGLAVESTTTGPTAGGHVATLVDVPDTWTRVSVSGAMTGAAAGNWCLILGFDGRIASHRLQTPITLEVWGAQLSDSASLDPYVASPFAAPVAGAYHGPRRDFDSAGSCRGLLVEEQRANLLTFSEAFDDAAWSKGGTATVTANTTTAPSGNTTADTFTGASGDPDTTATDTIWRTVTVASSTSYTLSVYLYGLTGTTAKIVLRDASTGNIGTRTVTLTAAWQRVTISLTSGAATTQFNVRIGGTNGTIAAWGAQLEAGSFATSYIPTGASSVDRWPDVASVATSAFPYSASASSLVVAYTSFGAGGVNILELSASASANGLLFATLSGTNNVATYVDASSVSLGATVLNAVTKLGIAYDGSSNGTVRNGGAVSSVGTTVSAAANKLCFGSSFGGLYQMSGHIRQVTYIPRRLSNAELQARTV